MSPLFAKLNLKDHRRIVVLDAPASFESELKALTGVSIERALERGGKLDFAIAFATTQAQLDAASKRLAAAATGDAIVWIAYPKSTSKRYRCEFNRDSGWTLLGQAGFEPVRQVAIDADWSALRFRKVEHIKAFTRAASLAVSTEGKARVAARKGK